MAIKLIDGFNELTKQQLFNLSLSHLRETRKQSMDPAAGGVYTYRGSGCAAAPFIVGREELNLEGGACGWFSFTARYGMSTHEANFVQQLQACHDSFVSAIHTDADEETLRTLFMAHFEGHMERLAHEHSLAYAPEDTQPGDRAV